MSSEQVRSNKDIYQRFSSFPSFKEESTGSANSHGTRSANSGRSALGEFSTRTRVLFFNSLNLKKKDKHGTFLLSSEKNMALLSGDYTILAADVKDDSPYISPSGLFTRTWDTLTTAFEYFVRQRLALLLDVISRSELLLPISQKTYLTIRDVVLLKALDPKSTAQPGIIFIHRGNGIVSGDDEEKEEDAEWDGRFDGDLRSFYRQFKRRRQLSGDTFTAEKLPFVQLYDEKNKVS